MEVLHNGYLYSDDKAKIDRQAVLDFLAQSYWAGQRDTQRILKSIETSHSYGVYHGPVQIGFARVITDEATFYYLCDVFVLNKYRGQGIGKKLIQLITNSEEYAGMTGALATRDAHGLYEQYGFAKEPKLYMRKVPVQ
ncbi:GNAT family N-acetyltransferase [Paenibacillus sp. M1]|uniref:GNAT family N-acetyltransferase n=1 Tax=Paenibacillus haidiansis TaxID=1574488 RepID=A0ABU7VNK6_9BACL